MGKLRNIFNKFLEYLFYFFLMLPIISVVAVVFYSFKPKNYDGFYREHEKVAYCIFGSALLTLGLVLTFGLEKILVFIPAGWGGYDEEGEWVTTRFSIASTLGGTFALYLVYLVGNISQKEKELEKKDDEIERLRKKLDE